MVLTIVIGLMGCSDSSVQPPITPGVSVGKVQRGMTAQQVVGRIGAPDLRSGASLSYERFGMVIYLRNDGTVGRVTCGDPEGIDGDWVKRFKGRTSLGIGMRSTRADVVEAYGESTEIDRSQRDHEVLKYRPLGLSFTLEDDKVHLIVVDLRNVE